MPGSGGAGLVSNSPGVIRESPPSGWQIAVLQPSAYPFQPIESPFVKERARGWECRSNEAYVVEIETTATSSVLYLYKKTETRAQGARHELVSMNWRSPAGTLVRAMRAEAKV